jgi:hypothetical protein
MMKKFNSERVMAVNLRKKKNNNIITKKIVPLIKVTQTATNRNLKITTSNLELNKNKRVSKVMHLITNSMILKVKKSNLSVINMDNFIRDIMINIIILGILKFPLQASKTKFDGNSKSDY